MPLGKIPTRPLGKTGLHVPVLSFGASPLGGIYQVRGRKPILRDRPSFGKRSDSRRRQEEALDCLLCNLSVEPMGLFSARLQSQAEAG